MRFTSFPRLPEGDELTGDWSLGLGPGKFDPAETQHLSSSISSNHFRDGAQGLILHDPIPYHVAAWSWTWPAGGEERSNSCALLPEPEDNMNKQADECWREDPEIRVELVDRVRREIAAGTYDTPEKFELALDRLLDRLEEE
jgi:hypothetical protein